MSPGGLAASEAVSAANVFPLAAALVTPAAVTVPSPLVPSLVPPVSPWLGCNPSPGSDWASRAGMQHKTSDACPVNEQLYSR